MNNPGMPELVGKMRPQGRGTGITDIRVEQDETDDKGQDK
jgi:hypothetical protein